MSLQFQPRYGIVPGDDNTGRVLTNFYLEPAYATTLVLNPHVSFLHVNMSTTLGVLTGALAVSATVTNAVVGDEVSFNFVSDSAGSHAVTFGAGFKSSGTITPAASKFASITFKFDGTNFVEKSRTVTA